MISLRYGTVYIIVLPTGPYKDSSYVHGLSSFSYSDSLFTMDAPPDPTHPRAQIPDPTNSTASLYVHGLSSFFYSDSLFTMDAPLNPRSQIPDPRSQIRHTTNSTANMDRLIKSIPFKPSIISQSNKLISIPTSSFPSQKSSTLVNSLSKQHTHRSQEVSHHHLRLALPASH